MLLRTRVFPGLAIVALLACSVLHADDKSAAAFRQKCAACHGADGKAETPAAKSLGVRGFASPEVAKMPDAELSAAIENGKGKMPSYGKSMKPEEIKAMVAYVRSLGK